MNGGEGRGRSLCHLYMAPATNYFQFFSSYAISSSSTATLNVQTDQFFLFFFFFLTRGFTFLSWCFELDGADASLVLSYLLRVTAADNHIQAPIYS